MLTKQTLLNLSNKDVLVTGASSMIGRSIVDSLLKRNVNVIPVFHKDVNLLEKEEVDSLFVDKMPEYVIHAAGYNGSIEWNRLYPADIFFKTAMMALNVLNTAQKIGVKKTVSILASCSYPDKGESVLCEEDLWEGMCNSSVDCHGLSKRILDSYSRQISKQYKTMCVSCILTNCYGPYDSFHPLKTKVVGAFIKKFVDAKNQGLEEVICWGTGNPLRELMFSKDAGEAIVQVLENYNDFNVPINIASDVEVSMSELANVVAKEVGYQGKITWDTTKQDGQMRKKLNTEKMHNLLDVKITNLEQGIKETVKWYNRKK